MPAGRPILPRCPDHATAKAIPPGCPDCSTLSGRPVRPTCPEHTRSPYATWYGCVRCQVLQPPRVAA